MAAACEPFKQITLTQFTQPYADRRLGLGSEEGMQQFLSPVATTVELADVTDVLNTTDKFTGKPAYDETTGLPVWASGPDPSDPWNGAGGAVSPLTTKGDLYTFDTADARLGVGTDGQVLIADSVEVTGLIWGSPSAGAGGSDSELQYNDGGVLNGIPIVTYDDVTGILRFDDTGGADQAASFVFADGFTVSSNKDIRFGDATTYITGSSTDTISFFTGTTEKFTVDNAVRVQTDSSAFIVVSGVASTFNDDVTLTGGELLLTASGTSFDPVIIPHGTAPTAATDGTLWTTSAGLFVRVSGADVGPLGTGGGVTATGTPVDNQIAIWDSSSSLEGVSGLTFDDSTNRTLTIGETAARGQLIIDSEAAGQPVMEIRQAGTFRARWQYLDSGDSWQFSTNIGGQINFSPNLTQTLKLDDGTTTFAGLAQTKAATASEAGLNLPPGNPPTTPVEGDMWTESAGAVNVFINGATVNLAGGDVSVSGTPVDNQIAVWDSASSIEGSTDLTFDGSVFTVDGDFAINDSSPQLRIQESDQTTDEKNWVIESSASTLQMRAYADGYTSSTVFLEVARTGITVDSFTVQNATNIVFDALTVQAGSSSHTTPTFDIDSAAAGSPSLQFQQVTVTKALIQYLDSGDIFLIDSDFSIELATSNTTAVTIDTSQDSTFAGDVIAANDLSHTGSLGFFGTTKTTQPTVTGAHGSNAALQSLLTGLASLGLIIDSST